MTWAVPPKQHYCNKVKHSHGNHPEDWTSSTGCDWTMTYSWTRNHCCEINYRSSYYVRAANAPYMWERCCFIHLWMGGVTKKSPRNNSFKHWAEAFFSLTSRSAGIRLISQQEEVTVMRKRSISQTRMLHTGRHLWAVSVWTPRCFNGHFNVQGSSV